MTILTMPGHQIRRLHQISYQIFSTRVQGAGLDLTPVQFATLDALHAEPGLDQAGIAARIAYDRATIGGVIDRLEQKGYVSRKTSRRDRRSKEVSLSQAGLAVYEEVLPIVRAVQSDILAGLDPDECRHFMALVAKAVSSADALQKSDT